MPYEYQLGVKDDESGVDWSMNQSSDGKKTEGSYRVLQPDGKTMLVEYVDNGDGMIYTITHE